MSSPYSSRRIEASCLLRDKDEVTNAIGNFGSWFRIVNEALAGKGNYDRNAAGAHEGTSISEDDSEGEGWKLLLGDFSERSAE